MSLVAYGDSDQSDDESSDSDQPLDATTKATTEATSAADEPDSTTADPSRLFARLPPPKQSTSVTSTPLDLSLQDIVKQPANPTKSKRAQILIPSLNGFDDEEDEEHEKKKFKPAQSGSGLMGLLPAPRHGLATSKQLMPQVLKRPSVPRDKGPPQPRPPGTAVQNDPWTDGDADGPDDSTPTSSFFTFEEPPLPKVDMASAENLSVTSTEKYPANVDQPEPEQEPDCTVPDYPQQQEGAESRRGKIVFAEHNEPGTSAFDVELDDGAVVRLRGRRDEEIHIIDVSADSQVDKSRVLIKGLTEEQSYSPASDTSDFNTSQTHRRKHQITYLAQQAKAREQELKNMWAQNRMTKRQTQAKYGF